jgi:hypothetical protein
VLRALTPYISKWGLQTTKKSKFGVRLTDNHFKTCIYTEEADKIEGYGNVEKTDKKAGEKYCVPSQSITDKTLFLKDAILQTQTMNQISIQSLSQSKIKPYGNSIQANAYCGPRFEEKSIEWKELGLSTPLNQGLTTHDDGRQLRTDHSIGMLQLCVSL